MQRDSWIITYCPIVTRGCGMSKLASVSRGCAALLMVVHTSLAAAQTCGLEPSPVLRFAPAAPRSNQSVTMTVGTLTLQPSSQTAVVTGTTINVTVTGSLKPPSQPPSCVAVSVGPLAAGSYTVNFLQDVPGQTPQVTLLTTRTLTVATSTLAIEPIPTTSTPALLVLTIVLAISGAALLRRA